MTHSHVWRDPYYRSGGEQLFIGLLTLLGLAIGVQVLAEIARAVLPLIITATAVVGLFMWFVGRRRW